jgi:predicted nucleic acid-binding protein
MIVLDTSLLSHAYRRRRQRREKPPEVLHLEALIRADVDTAVPGIVLQELLAGVRTVEQLKRVESEVSQLPLLLADRATHIEAAQIANRCRSKGVAVEASDCLIAAQTILAGAELFTVDTDFERIAAHTELRLYRAQ